MIYHRELKYLPKRMVNEDTAPERNNDFLVRLLFCLQELRSRSEPKHPSSRSHLLPAKHHTIPKTCYSDTRSDVNHESRHTRITLGLVIPCD